MVETELPHHSACGVADRSAVERAPAPLDRPPISAIDLICFLIVGAYLAGVFVFLLLTKQLCPEASIRRSLRATFRPKQRGKLQKITHDQGHCYTSPVDAAMISEAEGWSRIVVYENRQALARPHAPHDIIRKEGAGAYSHWAGMIYFSSSDKSDPRTNQRTYTFAEV